MRVAMVCLGNICRSPMAEAVAREMLAEAGLAGTVSVESFGTSAEHQGEGAHPRSLAALERRGWPLEGHRARKITSADLARIDLVLCLDRDNLRGVHRLGRSPEAEGAIKLLRQLDPTVEAGDDEVPDPWGYGDAAFDHSLDLIERACRGLIDSLALQSR